MKSLIYTVVSGLLIAATTSFAQEPRGQMAEKIDREMGSQITVRYGFDGRDNLSGGQFRVHYDSASMSVADLSGCLSGLPESHQGAFSVCNDVPEKGFVQFVVFDLGKNSPIGSDILGSITFNVDGKVERDGLSKTNLVAVEDIRLAGPDGGHLAIGAEAEGGVRLEVLR